MHMPIINSRIRFIEKFLENFHSAFSTKHQRSMFREFIYAMFSDYKRMSLSAIANNTAVNYQKLQFFFSESEWNTQELNDIRLRILQCQKTTGANKKGVLAVDEGIPFSSVVVDAWYTSTDLIEFTASKNKHLVAEVKINRSMLLTHPETRQWRYMTWDAIIPLIKKYYAHKIKSVSIPRGDGTDKNVLTYSFESKLKDCSIPVKVIFIFDKWSSADDKDVHILITTNTQMSSRDAILTYLLRWGIEESFRELKDSFCFDQYQVRDQKQIQRHWIMAFLAWTLTYWIKQNGCLSKILEQPPRTIGECKQAIASLIMIDSAFLLSKNKELACSLYNIKSERFKTKLKN